MQLWVKFRFSDIQLTKTCMWIDIQMCLELFIHNHGFRKISFESPQTVNYDLCEIMTVKKRKLLVRAYVSLVCFKMSECKISRVIDY